MKKILISLLLLPLCTEVYAENFECVGLKKNNSIELELKKSEGFNNCFYLDGIAANSDAQVIAFSNDTVKNKISLYDLNYGLSSNYIAEYHSDVGAANAFVINTGNRHLAFRITPTSHLTSDKNLSATYLLVNGVGQVILDLDDIPSTGPILPPPTGGCTYNVSAK